MLVLYYKTYKGAGDDRNISF